MTCNTSSQTSNPVTILCLIMYQHGLGERDCIDILYHPRHKPSDSLKIVATHKQVGCRQLSTAFYANSKIFVGLLLFCVSCILFASVNTDSRYNIIIVLDGQICTGKANLSLLLLNVLQTNANYIAHKSTVS